MTSHVSLSVLEVYRTASEQLDDNTASSVEDHMMTCAACRAALSRLTPTDEADRLWAAIVGELELSVEAATSKVRGFGRLMMLAAASIALIALAVVALAVRREPPEPAASTLPTGFVDLGSVDQLGPGEVRWVEEHHLYLVRTDTEYLLLSRRSPTRGCRLVTGDQLIAGITVVGSGATFADPCHGATFALDGTRLGGPTARGMYRYRFEIRDDRIVADLRLLVPGPLFDLDAEDAAAPLPGPGGVDATSQAWLNAADWAVIPVIDGKEGPSLWPLGAFHNTSTDVVTVYTTVSGKYLTLQVGTLEALDAVADPQGYTVARAHPDGGDRVVMVYFDSDDSDTELTAINVLLHIVEAFDQQP